MIKFIQKQIKNNVSKYVPQNDSLIYTIKNDLFINEEKILDEIDGGSIFKINNELVLIFDISNGYYYYEKEIIKSESLVSDKTF